MSLNKQKSVSTINTWGRRQKSRVATIYYQNRSVSNKNLQDLQGNDTVWSYIEQKAVNRNSLGGGIDVGHSK